MWSQPRARQAPGAGQGYRSHRHGSSHLAVSAGHRTAWRPLAGCRPQHLLDPFRGTVAREHGATEGRLAGARRGDGGRQPHGGAPTDTTTPATGNGAAQAAGDACDPRARCGCAARTALRPARLARRRASSSWCRPVASTGFRQFRGAARRTYACEEPIHGDEVPTVRVGFAGMGARSALRRRLGAEIGASEGCPWCGVVVNPETDSRWHSSVLAARRWCRSAPSGEAGPGSASVTRENCLCPAPASGRRARMRGC
ncbi:hypothetical protein FHX46_001467 [Amycolatopsis viridis]|uniref:Uncharacterized protein n=1 Tax=Amycolatopsis viridis TaxID=185678 RepID=A0ABX0SSQ8_9PSEU|nr:hypothetical protein [Amycolatopsis viridis]